MLAPCSLCLPLPLLASLDCHSLSVLFPQYTIALTLTPTPTLSLVYHSYNRVDIGLLHDELQSIGDMMHQEVSVSEHQVLFAECDHCVTAFAG